MRTERTAARRYLGWTLILCAVSAVGCRQDMHDQPKYSALEPSAFFGDASSARAPIVGTVARGHLREDTALYTGTENEAPVTVFPMPVDDRMMARGQEMFNAYCSPCHDRTGSGNGMVVQRGFSRPPSLVDPQMRDRPVGHFFDVITNGFGAMPDHAAQIKVADRWAIVAYLRALQLSVTATIDDVPAAERGRLDAGR